MTDLASLANPQAAPQQTPQQGLAGLLQKAANQRPTPNHAQTVAALHRCHEIEKATSRLLKDPDVGHKNIRPKVLTMGADLIGEHVMSLPELMAGIKDFPGADDALGQKKWLERLYQAQIQAQTAVLQDHANAPPEDNESQWTPDTHGDHMSAVTNMYQR